MNRVFAVIFAAAILAVTGVSCKHDKTGAALPGDAGAAVQVSTLTVSRAMAPDVYEAVGTVRANRSSTLSAKVMGAVMSVHVQEGDRVTAGQELVFIEARDIDAQVRQAQAGQAQASAGYAQALAGLAQAGSGLSEADAGIAAAEAGLAAARADADLASKTFARYSQLYDEKSVSLQEFDQIRAQRDKAAAGVSAADKQVQAMRAKRKQALAQIDQAKAMVNQALAMGQQSSAAVDQAQVMRAYAVIRAPYDGIVVRKIAEAGQLASPGMPLLVVEEDSDLRLEAAVDESRVSGIHIGDSADVRIDALGGESLPGVVQEITPTGDSASRSFVVKVGLPSAPGLMTGMFGRAQFLTGESEKLLIPVSALVARGSLQGVFIVDSGNVARFRVVRIGDPAGRSDVEVYSGLDPGEKIVSENADSLTDGRKVKER